MLRRSVAAALGFVALAGPAAVRAEEPDRPPAVVPADRLPVLGTVGDYPPEAERLVLDLHAGTPSSLSVDGTRLERRNLPSLLRTRARPMRAASPHGTSPLHIVIRADRAVRWQDTQWVLQAAAHPGICVNRVLFAAMPEDGGDEGAMALFLPDCVSPPDVPPDGPRVVLPVALSGSQPGPSDAGPSVHFAAARFRAAAKGSRVVARLDAERGVSTGAVLRVADALLRSGVQVVLKGTTVSTADEAIGAATPPHAAAPEIRIQGELVAGSPPADSWKPLARVRGALAGQTSVYAAPDVDASALIEEDDSDTGPRVFGGRRSGHRNLKLGATQETENAVFRGLEWLKAHQSPNGSWNSDGFEAACGDAKCGGSGGPLYDVGVTGLATLAFLGWGETHKTPRYGHVVRNAMKFLKNVQDAEGCFGARTSPHFTYNHAIATLAMAEVYGLTQSQLFKSSAQAGVNFILQCRNPGLAWRYGVRPQDNDTSITGWMVMALKAAKSAGLDVPQDAFEGAVAWLDKVTDPETGRAGYTVIGNGPARPQAVIEQFPSGKSESLTAIAVLSRIFSGAKQDDPMVRKGTALCLAVLPRHDDAGTVDFTYWHFGTLAMFQVSGDAWKRWHDPMKAALVLSQRNDEGHARGSWDPKDPWGGEGGRIYSTALAVLCLEVYYRYARVFGDSEEKPK